MIKKVEFLGLYNEPQDLGLKFKNLVAPGVPSLFIMESTKQTSKFASSCRKTCADHGCYED